MEQIHVISHGMGQDSATMLARICSGLDKPKGRLLVIWADTGGEKPETYAYAERIQRRLKELEIAHVFIRPGSEYHQPAWPSVLGRFEATGTIAMRSVRACTDKGKLVPIYNALDAWIQKEYGIKGNAGGRGKLAIKEFARTHGKITVSLGFAAGEEKRKAKSEKAMKSAPRWFRDSITKIYPLITAGLNRAGCQNQLKELGWEIPLPSFCWFCPFSQKHDLAWLDRKHPDLLKRMITLEDMKKAAHLKRGGAEDKNHGIFGVKSVAYTAAAAVREYRHHSDAQLEELVNTHGTCVTNAY